MENLEQPAADPNDAETTWTNVTTQREGALTRIVGSESIQQNRLDPQQKDYGYFDRYLARSTRYQDMIAATIPEYVGSLFIGPRGLLAPDAPNA